MKRSPPWRQRDDEDLLKMVSPVLHHIPTHIQYMMTLMIEDGYHLSRATANSILKMMWHDESNYPLVDVMLAFSSEGKKYRASGVTNYKGSPLPVTGYPVDTFHIPSNTIHWVIANRNVQKKEGLLRLIQTQSRIGVSLVDLYHFGIPLYLILPFMMHDLLGYLIHDDVFLRLVTVHSIRMLCDTLSKILAGGNRDWWRIVEDAVISFAPDRAISPLAVCVLFGPLWYPAAYVLIDELNVQWDDDCERFLVTLQKHISYMNKIAFLTMILFCGSNVALRSRL
eukprot:TRINITY_DN3348_c0_g2_i1.p1 TRINITY_DN3348_c0_g2~~TRINITY_DN3348_c0_g2_i1.p1  ORF type:complete len:282 (+),score=23.52 TRINITY_DN3348_c0_g2_i1:299-1144(+)